MTRGRRRYALMCAPAAPRSPPARADRRLGAVRKHPAQPGRWRRSRRSRAFGAASPSPIRRRPSGVSHVKRTRTFSAMALVPRAIVKGTARGSSSRLVLQLNTHASGLRWRASLLAPHPPAPSPLVERGSQSESGWGWSASQPCAQTRARWTPSRRLTRGSYPNCCRARVMSAT